LGGKIKIDLSILIKDMKPRPRDKPPIGGLIIEKCGHCGRDLMGSCSLCPYCHKPVGIFYGQ
jgi:hypothetical protein